MKLGNFSVSLNVKDIKASRSFYLKLGFKKIHGNEAEGWLILKNGNTNIGLFQGMINKNTLTFNPGWDSDGQETPEFTDIRTIEKKLEQSGLKLIKKSENKSGPDRISLKDPDGNPILIDQHRN